MSPLTKATALAVVAAVAVCALLWIALWDGILFDREAALVRICPSGDRIYTWKGQNYLNNARRKLFVRPEAVC
jgi:hypothetical protein